jgi:hypothetical protein
VPPYLRQRLSYPTDGLDALPRLPYVPVDRAGLVRQLVNDAACHPRQPERHDPGDTICRMTRMAIFVVALALPAHADLTVKSSAHDDWGAPEVVLRVESEFGIHDIEAVLYASGRLLYRDFKGGVQPADYFVVALTPAEKRALVDGLALSRVGALHPSKNVGADGATFCIDVWTAGTRKSDCIWGNIENDWPDLPPPPEMSAIWRRLAHFTSPRAQKWVPNQVTVSVMSWRCGHDAATHSAWPARWPTHGEPFKTLEGDGFRFTVGGNELPELRRLEKTRLPSGCIQPVVVEGRNMYTSFSYSLPHDEVWWRGN